MTVVMVDEICIHTYSICMIYKGKKTDDLTFEVLSSLKTNINNDGGS